MNEWDKVIKNIDIKELISEETGLKFNNQNKLEECPFCGSGKKKNGTPGLSVKPTDNIFNCFSCDKKGGSVEFIEFKNNLSKKEAAVYLLKKYSNGYSSDGKYTLWEKKLYAIQKNEISPAVKYLKDIRRIEVDKLPDGSFFYNSLQNSIVFLSQNKRLINQRFLIPEKGKPKANVSLEPGGYKMKDCLYDICFSQKKDKLFLTEGVINALSIWPHSSISILSTSNQIEDIAILKKYVEGKEIILAFDNDVSGDKATDYYYQLLVRSGLVMDIYKLKLPNMPIIDPATKDTYENPDLNDLLKCKLLSVWIKKKSNYEHLYENKILKPIPVNIPDKDEFYFNNGFFIEEGCYYIRTNKGIDISISDFLFNTIYHFPDTTNNSLRYIKIQNEKGSKFILLDSRDISSIQAFKSAMISQGEFNFTGATKDLENVRKFHGKETETAYRIEILGWSPEENRFFFSNGLINNVNKFVPINNFGIVNDGDKSFFIPAHSEMFKNDGGYSEQRKFFFKPGRIILSEFATKIRKAYKIQGVIGMLFTLSSIFSDIVFSKTGFFPLLFLYGPAESGKSSFINMLLSFYGDPQKAISLSGVSTEKSMFRRIAQITNGIIYFNEYKPETARNYDDMLVGFWDRTGYDRAQTTNDLRTHQTPVGSAAIVDGNFLPVRHQRVYSRFIQVDFIDEYSSEQYKAYRELEDVFKEESFSSMLLEVHRYRKFYDSSFRKTYIETHDELKKEYPGLHKRIYGNYGVLLASLKIFNSPFKLGYDYKEVKNEIMVIAKAQNDILNNTSESQQFFEAISVAIKTNDLNLNCYSLDEQHLCLHFGSAFAAYARQMKNIGGITMDKQAIDKLLQRHPFSIDRKARKRLNGDVTRVWIFKAECINV